MVARKRESVVKGQQSVTSLPPFRKEREKGGAPTGLDGAPANSLNRAAVCGILCVSAKFDSPAVDSRHANQRSRSHLQRLFSAENSTIEKVTTWNKEQ